MYPNSIKSLISCLKELPGIGDKTAERLAYSIVNFDQDKLEDFAESILSIKNNIRNCSVCNCITDMEKCAICSDDARSNDTIFVVEKSKDVILFEKMGTYKGKYHVLGGLISPMDGVNPEDIKIKELVDRIINDKVKEVIIVLKPSIEGETTTQYIKKILSQFDVKISKIPIGIPMGTDIEYIDTMTLEMAFEDRKSIS